MGNKEVSSHQLEASAASIMKKNDIQFKQSDFIKETEQKIQNSYDILSPCLQVNQYYEIRKAIHLKTQIIRQVCIINKYKIRSKERQQLQTQIAKVKKLDDPGLVKTYELFKDDYRFYIVSEYSSGDSLADVLEKQGYFQQRAAASIMLQLIKIIKHCGQRDIYHGDMKLENIFFNSKKQDSIKISDFNIARIFRIEEIIQQSYGKALLVAPEVVNFQAHPKSDLWSCGLILYILLCGQPPIIGTSQPKFLKKLKTFRPKFNETKFRHVSRQAKQLIISMLKFNPNERISHESILNHEWFNIFKVTPQISCNMQRCCLQELSTFNTSSKLQQATWTFFVSMLISFDEKQTILAVFNKLDRNCKGELHPSDIEAGFAEVYGEDEDVVDLTKTIMNRLGKDRIIFSEFVVYCTNRFFMITDSNIVKIFAIFDKDNNGQITIGELRDTLGNSKQLSEKIWLQLMREADSNSDGLISMEQFKEMIKTIKADSLKTENWLSQKARSKRWRTLQIYKSRHSMHIDEKVKQDDIDMVIQ